MRHSRDRLRRDPGSSSAGRRSATRRMRGKKAGAAVVAGVARAPSPAKAVATNTTSRKTTLKAFMRTGWPQPLVIRLQTGLESFPQMRLQSSVEIQRLTRKVREESRKKWTKRILRLKGREFRRLLAFTLIDPGGDLHPAETAYVLRNAPYSDSAMRWRYSGVRRRALIAWVADERDFGQDRRHVGPDQHDKRGFFYPRSRIPGLFAARPLCSACCTLEANSRDSSIFSFSAIFFTRS